MQLVVNIRKIKPLILREAANIKALYTILLQRKMSIILNNLMKKRRKKSYHSKRKISNRRKISVKDYHPLSLKFFLMDRIIKLSNLLKVFCQERKIYQQNII